MDSGRAIGDMEIVHDNPEILNITLPYTDRAQVSSTLTATANYVRGSIRGVFRDYSQPNEPLYRGAPRTVTSILFDASTNLEGNRIEFSTDTAEYEGVAITWSLVTCTPKDRAVQDLPLVETMFEPLNEDQKQE